MAKKGTGKILLLIAVVCSSLLHSTPAYCTMLAQSTPPFLNAVGRNERQAEQQSVLSDPRLSMRVSIALSRVTIGQIIHQFARQSQTPMQVDPVLEKIVIGVRFQSTPLREAMASIALSQHLRWRKTPQQVFILEDVSSKAYLDMFQPRNAEQAARDRLGRKFLDQISILPQEQQTALASGMGVPISALPPNVQDTLAGMLSAALKDSSLPSRQYALSADKVGSDSVQVNATPPANAPDVECYNVGFVEQQGDRTVAMGFPIPRFKDAQAEYHVVSDPNLTSPRIVEFSENRIRASKADPRLKKKVTLAKKQVTFLQALQQLAAQAPFDFVCVNPDVSPPPLNGSPVYRSFSFTKLPLDQALGQLATIFQFKLGPGDCRYEWSETPGQTLMFLPMNTDTAVKLEALQLTK